MTTVETPKKNRTWIWILGGAALLCLCAVAVLTYAGIRLGQKVEEGVKTDPAQAAKAARAIADYELPPGYQEQMSIDLFGLYSMAMIADPDESSKPMIMLAQFQASADPQQMEDQIRRSFEQQSGRRGLKMEEVESKEMTIRGEEVTVTTYEGTDENGNGVRQLVTTFPGKGGTAMLMIMGTPENWDQEEIDTFIESIE